MTRSRRPLVALLVATALLAGVTLASKLDALPEGLKATYFSDANWSSDPVRSTIDPQPSTDSIAAAWSGSPPRTFSVTWTGWFVVLRPGTYSFATTSADGAAVYIDERLVVDNGGRHEPRFARGTAHLERGLHAMFIEYFCDRDDVQFELSSARDADPLQPVPAWTLFSRRAEFRRVLASFAVRRSVPAVFWLWLAALGVAVWSAAHRSVARAALAVVSDRTLLALACIIVGAFALDAAGVWWGVPSFWAGDEIAPKPVLIGLSQHFSGGWFNRYPPLQFYILSAVFSPWLAMQSLGVMHLPGRLQEPAFLLLSRCVSLAAATGTLIAIYKCGVEAFGRRTGVFAAAMFALLTPFVYYSKTANPEVPYIFWIAVSLVFYLRVLRTPALRELILFSCAAVLAVCTKDQAFAVYLLTPLPIVYRVWESNRERGIAHPLRRAVLNWRLGIAAVVAAALFAACYLLPFNATGFIRHVQDIVGPGSEGYRMVEPGINGRLKLLALTAGLDLRSWGWPLCLASVIGFGIALTEKRHRRLALCLALAAASYYLGFIDIILYNYDRYLLPICVVQALFGGVAFDRLLGLSAAPARTWRVAVIAGVFAYSFLYAATVDVLMVRDSRYTAEAWLRVHAGEDHLIGTVFPLVVLPRLHDMESIDIGSIDTLRRWTPSYFVLNADYARAVAPDTPAGQLVSGLRDETLGYRLAFRYRAPAPWPWLPGADPDLVGRRLGTSVSFLRAINPTMEIFQRIDVGR
jgi:hypothetical protein